LRIRFKKKRNPHKADTVKKLLAGDHKKGLQNSQPFFMMIKIKL